ncbi:MAG TPA: ABC transporter permease [Pyrinomonadaceae bacterium]|nr:ABC transporter permease [Pyrinomonadaceae bacterium]
MGAFWHDLRHGLRTLVQKPGFTLVAVITLGLGIGANTAIFSVVNAVLLRPLPFPNADRLVAISENSLKALDISVAYPDYLDWRAQQSVFEEMSARMPTGGIITGANEPERVIGRLVSPSFFSTLGVQPMLGRAFTEAESKPGTPPVMVISHGLWQRQFGGASDVIGKSITYNGEPWTVIGVMPSWFDFYGRTNVNNDVFVPLGYLNNLEFMQDRNSHTVRVTARLKPGVSIEQARSELSALSARMATQYPASNTGIGANTRSFLDDYVGDQRQSLRVIFTAVAFMLLIACANVANLMLARATTRRREIALRLALGASRWRIVRQLITESVMLALAGGAFGVLLATWGIKLLSRLNVGELSRLDEVSIDGRVLGFTFLITLVVGIVSGLFPALQNSRLSLNEALKEGDRISSAGAGGRLRRSLVAVEVALALMLLVGAGLTVKSFNRLTSVEPGFNPQNVLTFRLRLPDAKYKEASQTFAFCREAMSRVSALPGVEHVAVATGFPLGRASENGYLVEGQPEPLPGLGPRSYTLDVSEDYHNALKIPLLEGRLFNAQDTEKDPLVVIVDQEFVTRSFPNQTTREVLGKRLRFGGDNDGWRQIVGVVGHVKQSGLNEESRAQIYRPWTQITPKWKAALTRATDMIVKTSVDPIGLIGAIKREIRIIDKDQPIAQVQTLDDKLSESIAPQRFTLLLLGIFALIAMLLASAGIYGVMSYAVSQRTHEIGVRMALGARQLDVLKLMVRQGMGAVLIGLGLGLVGAFATTRLMTSLLFDVTALDPLTFVVVTVVLTIVALFACYIPARRATKVSPLVALRYE